MAEMLYHGPYEIRIRRVRTKNIEATWGNPLSDPLVAANIAYNLTKEEDQEVLFVVGLDASDRVLFVQELYRGTNGNLYTRIAEMFRAAITENARKVLIFHNHPSGDPTPSEDDIAVLTRLVEGGKILGIAIQDFQVVCDDPNLFWSAQIATDGNLMNINLDMLETKRGRVDRNLLGNRLS